MLLLLQEYRRITVSLFFKKKKENRSSSGLINASAVQCVPSDYSGHPFASLENYLPFRSAEYELYNSLREALPIIDGAIGKLVRLTGDFSVKCNNTETEQKLRNFLQSVNVNGCSTGINSFLTAYLDQLLTYGQAVGEIVTDKYSFDIAALYNGSLKDISIKSGENPLEIVVCKNDCNKTPLPYQDLIAFSMLNKEPGRLKGNSILKGLPFVSSVLLKIFNSIGTNFERMGNVRFAVTYKPDGNAPFTNTREQVRQIADEWSKAMHSRDGVCDFVCAGDVSIKVIGADNQVIDCDVPIKHMLEQIVAKLAIPPFLLGLSWSSTERMSSQQTDILTSELEYYRQQLNPVIRKICTVWMRLNGRNEDFEIVWDNINLQDEVELAQARLYNAQAQALEKENNNQKGEDF